MKNMELGWKAGAFSLSEETCFPLPAEMISFYVSDRTGENGFPTNGTLFEDDNFCGRDAVSIFDPVYQRSRCGLAVIPGSVSCSWRFVREGDARYLFLSSGEWTLREYEGNQPDWSLHEFTFRNLPEESPELHHARIRGLLDFCSGTRTADAGFHYQSPNTMIGKGYLGDGIPDTFFQFISVYKHLSDERKSWFRDQFNWLGANMRFDGCIPWGGCIHGKPYYKVWKREDCGLFFDGNGLWLDVMLRICRDGKDVQLDRIVRAADFYLHYLSPDGLLVAAESKMRGCEWADLIQNGWKTGIINVEAFHGLKCAARIMEIHNESELAARYDAAADRLKAAINLPVEEGGLWMGNGLADWVDMNGEVMRTWRIDANMLAIVWDALTPEHAAAAFACFKQGIMEKKFPVPFPYLLHGSWAEPVDRMLDGCREFGCGLDAMPGRMGAVSAAAARKMGDEEVAGVIYGQLLSLINGSEYLFEKYRLDGVGYGTHSYVEHAVSIILADEYAAY